MYELMWFAAGAIVMAALSYLNSRAFKKEVRAMHSLDDHYTRYSAVTGQPHPR